MEAADFISDRMLDFLCGFPWNLVRLWLKETRDTILEEKERLALTDKPIDQVVYKLYGLTEEEVVIVEGEEVSKIFLILTVFGIFFLHDCTEYRYIIMKKKLTQLGAREDEFLLTFSGTDRNIFTLQEAKRFWGCAHNARIAMHRLIAKGWLAPIENGKYLIIPLI